MSWYTSSLGHLPNRFAMRGGLTIYDVNQIEVADDWWKREAGHMVGCTSVSTKPTDLWDRLEHVRMKKSRIARLRDAAAERQEWRCYYCGMQMVDATQQGGHACTAEHLVARLDGGHDRADNNVAACWYCNSHHHRRQSPPAPAVYRLLVQAHITKAGGKPVWSTRMPSCSPTS